MGLILPNLAQIIHQINDTRSTRENWTRGTRENCPGARTTVCYRCSELFSAAAALPSILTSPDRHLAEAPQLMRGGAAHSLHCTNKSSGVRFCPVFPDPLIPGVVTSGKNRTALALNLGAPFSEKPAMPQNVGRRALAFSRVRNSVLEWIISITERRILPC